MKEGKETIKYISYDAKYLRHKKWWQSLSPEEKREYTRRKVEAAKQKNILIKTLIKMEEMFEPKELSEGVHRLKRIKK